VKNKKIRKIRKNPLFSFAVDAVHALAGPSGLSPPVSGHIYNSMRTLYMQWYEDTYSSAG
jgi:hypothetical protein